MALLLTAHICKYITGNAMYNTDDSQIATKNRSLFQQSPVRLLLTNFQLVSKVHSHLKVAT